MKIFSSILIAVVFIVLAILMSSGGKTPEVSANNVSIVDGKQIVDLRAKVGYSPQKSVAKAGIPTIVRFTTSGTYDCSSAVRFPSMNISKNLELSGTTDVDLGIPKLGVLHGSCGMGMYPFEIDFQA